MNREKNIVLRNSEAGCVDYDGKNIMCKMKYFVAVNVLFLIYSLTSILGKIAANENSINIRFILCYSGLLCLMGLYALGWQQIIKKLPLMVAYANKAVIIIWGMLWGILFFREPITFGKLAGALIVIIGVVVFATSEREEDA